MRNDGINLKKKVWVNVERSGSWALKCAPSVWCMDFFKSVVNRAFWQKINELCFAIKCTVRERIS